MGHTGKHLINPTIKYLGIQTTGKCEHCARVQIRQANIPKVSKGQQAKKPGERIVDEATDYTNSFFLKICSRNIILKSRKSGWTTVEKTECYKQNLINKT